MSEFHVQVVEVGKIQKHPNADTLSIADVCGYPVIVRTGEYNEGDRAVYVPVDAVVPENDPRWEFLGGHRRIKAKKLRGIFSMGLLTQADPSWELGQNVQEALRIEKYEPEIACTMGRIRPAPIAGPMPFYTDIEALRRWPNILEPGEEVVLTEKIHGANARFCFAEGKLWCGSRTTIRHEDDEDMWWKIARTYVLDSLLARVPGVAFYGEIYGNVQDLKYEQSGVALRVFDVCDTKRNAFLDHNDMVGMTEALSLPRVPILYRGPWTEELRSMAEGTSKLASHVREGFVVRPVRERWHERLGRVVLKHVGEGYLLRKGA